MDTIPAAADARSAGPQRGGACPGAAKRYGSPKARQLLEEYALCINELLIAHDIIVIAQSESHGTRSGSTG
jgi:hypothetical protein